MRSSGYLASDEGEAEVEAEFESTRALGLRSVPTFVFDGQYVVEGAQPASTFLQALEEVQRGAVEVDRVSGPAASGDSRPEESVGANGSDCADGSCAVGV